MKGRQPIATYIGVQIEVWRVVPKSWSLKKQAEALAGKLYPTSCDVDNQAKACLDGMNEIVYVDDRFISELSITRKFAREEKAIIMVRSLIADTPSDAWTSVSDQQSLS